MTRLILSTLALFATMACGVELPPITIAVPPPASVPDAPPTPGVATPGEIDMPPGAAEPAPEAVEPPSAPLVNLNIVVHDAVTGVGIPRATCTLGDEIRSADGGGFINFAVRGSEVVRCAAGGYEARLPLNLPPGDHRVPLVPIAPPAPPAAPPVVTPPTSPGLGVAGCGKAGNTMAISGACLTAVAAVSKSYPRCQAGDGVACHRFVREVALALRTTQGDHGWGLITKPRGQQACALEGDFTGSGVIGCGRSIEGGYGEDMVAYLPAGNPVNLWTGLDIIVGAGAPGAHHAGGVLPPAVGGRPDNLWAPVP